MSELDFSIGIIVDTAGSTEMISSILGLSPSKIFQTEHGSKWVLRRTYKNKTDINHCIEEYFIGITHYAEKIHKVKQHGSCVFRISVVSRLGQFGFSLSESDLHILNQLDIPVEISVFSFGCCIDDLDRNET